MVQHVDAIHPDSPGLEFVNSIQSTVNVFGEDGSGETVKGVVGLTDNIVLVLPLDHNSDRPEDLFLNDLHIRLGFREDRWLKTDHISGWVQTRHKGPGGRRAYLDKVTLGSTTFTAEVNVCPLRFSRFNIRHDTLEGPHKVISHNGDE